jgi:hypothetical protein
MKSNNNRTLSKARANKNDEFYTQLNDISNELKHYKAQLKGKTVLCNCDDPFESHFFKYFALNFNSLGLKKLIATSYSRSPIVGKQLALLEMEGLKPECKDPYAVEINEVPDVKKRGATDITDVEYLLKRRANTSRTLKGDDDYAAGDFRSKECVALLKQSDVVITNPPFSLFREFVEQLAAHKKKFLIVGNQNAILYKEVFKLIKDGKLWLGVDNGGTKWFQVPDDYDIETESRKKIVDGVKYFSMGSIAWFTNLDHKRRHEMLPLYKKYTKKDFPNYDNYDAIEVSKVAEIPKDFPGVMGVPITFLDKYNADQFELLGSNRGIDQDPNGVYGRSSLVKGKETFKRLFIRNRLPEAVK